METITVKKYDTELRLTDNSLKYEVITDKHIWKSQGRDSHIVFYNKISGVYVPSELSFENAEFSEHSYTSDSIISIYSGFKQTTAVICLTAKIIGKGKIDFSVEAYNENEFYLKSLYYPPAFNLDDCDNESSYSVESDRQGFILYDTDNNSRDVLEYLINHERVVNTGEAYMPLWGRVCGNCGYSAFADESYDLALRSCYGKNNAFLTSSEWLSSLGKLNYKRVLHLYFYDGCNYVSIAKDFRKHEIKKGRFITIDEKIKRNPNVKRLIGTPVIHWNLLEHNEKSSEIYKNTGIYERIHNTFSSSIIKFSEFKKAGLKHAYIHTDGWGSRGYDNLHPYILPPSDKIGGFEGMRELSNYCDSIDYDFGLHDQYRDYYQDSSVYDENKCITDINGKLPFCDIWAGGAHNWLCAEFAKSFVKRTYDELDEHGIKIKGAYLDVFGIVAGDECFNPDHMLTRKESILKRGECFDMLRSRGIIVSSEETGCQMIEYLDLVHHAPYAVNPQGGGKRIGIPVPLTNLVYHDCVFVPWICSGKGGWGIPDEDSGRMHCILNAQTPYYNQSMRQYEDKRDFDELKRHTESINEAASVNALLYNKEMLNHEFLDSNFRIQRTTFSDGTQITVDFDKDIFKIEKSSE